MKYTVIALSAVIGSILAMPAVAETEPSKAAMEKAQIVLDKVNADKKYITSKNLTLTDAESKAFWPLYDQYQQNLAKLNGRIAVLILTYAEAYKAKTMNDDLARKLMAETIAIDADELEMKKAFMQKLERALPGIKAARYMQIENKLRALVKLKLADEIPLVE